MNESGSLITHKVPHPISASPFGTLISRTLPKYTGPYPVGVRDVEVPVAEQTFGEFVLKSDYPKSMDSLGSRGSSDIDVVNVEIGKSVGSLILDTVLFTLFYPAVDQDAALGQKKKSSVIWFPKLGQTVDGFLRMGGIVPNWLYRSVAYPMAALLIYGVTFPGLPSAPLLRRTLPSGDPEKFPLVLFSPGVGTSRLMYSAICSEIASRGYVVAALEHRDGTSPVSTVLLPNGQTRMVSWLKWSDLYWPSLGENGQPEDDTHLRHVQLQMRIAELKAARELIRSITSTGALDSEDDQSNWSSWKDAVDARDGQIIAAGHSLGGTAVIQAAIQPSPMHFQSILAFDPALQRCEADVNTFDTELSRPPLFVLNSAGFTHESDWSRLRTLVQRWRGHRHIGWMPGTTHPSLSDLPLILPSFINRLTGLRVDPVAALKLIIGAVADFLWNPASETSRTQPTNDCPRWKAEAMEEKETSWKGRESIVWCL